MIIYKDIVTGDELFSDSYKMKKVDDFFYELEGKMTSEGGGIDDALIGGNASAEGGAEALDEVTQKGCNIVLAHKLQSVAGLSKKEYQLNVKKYIGKIVDHLKKENPDRVDPFKAAGKTAMAKIFENFKDFDLFVGENDDGGDPKGMIALMNFREDGVTPYMLFIADGLVEEKF